jgi:hypothetical protein
MFPKLDERGMREVGWKIGLARGLGVAYVGLFEIRAP